MRLFSILKLVIPLPIPLPSFPVVSIVGIVCESYNVLCATSGFNPHFANVYLEAIDFVSIR